MPSVLHPDDPVDLDPQAPEDPQGEEAFDPDRCLDDDELIGELLVLQPQETSRRDRTFPTLIRALPHTLKKSQRTFYYC